MAAAEGREKTGLGLTPNNLGLAFPQSRADPRAMPEIQPKTRPIWSYYSDVTAMMRDLISPLFDAIFQIHVAVRSQLSDYVPSSRRLIIVAARPLIKGVLLESSLND